MLKIKVQTSELFDEEKREFVYEEVELELMHSLSSLSKWESKWEKPFLSKDEKTIEEVVDYIRCMSLGHEPPSEVLQKLSQENLDAVKDHIGANMSATWFSETAPTTRSQEAITAELIYYWMTAFQIPFECENWHLSRLFTLIKVCNLKNQKPKKMGRSEIARRNRELNEKRRRELGTSG